jgi:hypothetical protein
MTNRKGLPLSDVHAPEYTKKVLAKTLDQMRERLSPQQLEQFEQFTTRFNNYTRATSTAAPASTTKSPSSARSAKKLAAG